MKSEIELTFNKDLAIDHAEARKKIEEAGYTYFEWFNREGIQAIAWIRDINEIPSSDLYKIVQAIFPEYLICSGLFDGVLLFRIKNGKRVDPPDHYYGGFNSFLDNGKNGKREHRLRDEIKDLFEKNGIKPSLSWQNYLEGKKGED